MNFFVDLQELCVKNYCTYAPSFCCSDAADKVVQRTGKFEELVVASHDIAASTAQLVAASRVKARPKSEKLKSLKSSSRAGVCVHV